MVYLAFGFRQLGIPACVCSLLSRVALSHCRIVSLSFVVVFCCLLLVVLWARLAQCFNCLSSRGSECAVRTLNATKN